LQQQKRAILDQVGGKALAARLFECATIHGAASLQVSSGELKPGAFADFFTVDLKDVSIAGNSAENLLPIIVFSLNRSAIRDVVVNGRFILHEQRHEQYEEIVSRYRELHEKIWSDASGR
jgi:formimidoylglutamate deiminase